MELEIINKLFLELSQFATATTANEFRLRSEADAKIERLETEIKRLHKEIKYCYLYQSFLLGQTSKENFKELAKEYVEPLNIDREIEAAMKALSSGR
jgi:hypothetical protein